MNTVWIVTVILNQDNMGKCKYMFILSPLQVMGSMPITSYINCLVFSPDLVSENSYSLRILVGPEDVI